MDLTQEHNIHSINLTYFKWLLHLWEYLYTFFCQSLSYLFKIIIARLPTKSSFKMKGIFFDDTLIVAKIRTKTSPESIDHIWFEFVPEVWIEFLFSIEKIENIRKVIHFIVFHILDKWNFGKSWLCKWIFKNKCLGLIPESNSILPFSILDKRTPEWCNRTRWPIWQESLIENIEDSHFRFFSLIFIHLSWKKWSICIDSRIILIWSWWYIWNEFSYGTLFSSLLDNSIFYDILSTWEKCLLRETISILRCKRYLTFNHLRKRKCGSSCKLLGNWSWIADSLPDKSTTKSRKCQKIRDR